MKKISYLFLLMLAMAGSVMGQQVEKDLFELSLEELMNIEIDVASGKGTTLRESPGIISYIDAEEIKGSGARDIMDVLRLIPGFEFGGDVDQTLGIGVRGNWGFEGKVLFLLDGQQINETSYGTYNLSQRIPIENIEKIEVIRGPGSAMYGGVAGLAVIKITTKSGADLNGGLVTARYGISEGKTMRENILASFGKSISDDISFSASAYFGKGRQSTGSYEALDGRTINYGDSAMLSSTNINIGAKIKGLNARFIYDDLELPNVTEYSSVYFNGMYFGADYAIKTSDKLTVTPRFNYKSQQPWTFNAKDVGVYNPKNSRLTGNITADWNANEKFGFVFGAEYYQDNSKIMENDFEYTFENGDTELSFTDLALFADATYKSKFANITAGLRYDDHSAVDAAFVPRIGLTKVIKDWHLKLLYSEAFKTPVIENINVSPGIKPERISVAEFETGYRLNENMVLSANVFYTRIEEVIVYSEEIVDGDLTYDYVNYPHTGTAGLEIDYKYKGKWGYVNASYSMYKASKDSHVEAYAIEGNDELFLGLPGQKFSANAHLKLAKNLYLNPTLLYFSAKYYYEYDADWNRTLQKLDNTIVGHIHLSYENFLTEGLSTGIGLYNIGNSDDMYAQPYDGGGLPVLAPSRELTFNLSYRF